MDAARKIRCREAGVRESGWQRLLFAGPNPLIWGIVGLVFCTMAWRSPAPSAVADVVLSVFMLTVFGCLLTEYRGALLHDQMSRLRGLPVTERTFFLCRLANLLRWTGLMVSFVSAPAVVLVVARDGLLAGMSWAIAVALSSTFVAFVAAGLLGAPLGLSRRTTAGRWIGYTAWLVVTLVIVGSLAMPLVVGGANEGRYPLALHLVSPPVWFAAIVSLAGGDAGSALDTSTAILALFSAYFVMERLWMSRGSFWPDARSKVALDPRPFGRLRSSSSVLPPEGRACMTLILAHLRRDGAFQARVLLALGSGIAVLGLCLMHYVGIGPAAARLDGFMALGLIHVVAIGTPLSWLDALQRGQSCRASLILSAVSKDPGRVLLWSGAVLSLVLIMPFVVIVSLLLFLALGGGLQAVAHAALLSLVVYGVINVALVINPQMPFSVPESRRKVYSPRRFIGHVAGWSTTLAFLPAVLYAVSSTLWAAVVFGAALIASVVVLRRTLISSPSVLRRVKWCC